MGPAGPTGATGATGATGPMPNYRANTATINSGSSSVTVSMSSAMPNANYIAVVTPGGTTGAANCLVVSNRTTTQFTISNLNCNSGAPANVSANLLVFWIAVEPN
jgi:hypothetical protein